MAVKRAVILLSGGLDSSTLAFRLASEDYDLLAISVDYNQRHGERELQASVDVMRALRDRYPERLTEQRIVDLGPAASGLLAGSALTSSAVAVPRGHYTADSMRATIVPNRNAVLLSLAYAAAVSHRAEVVATAVHAGDHAIYPDCRPDFVRAFERMEWLATGDSSISLAAPYLYVDKTEIVRQGLALGVPYALTWSCYEGGETHCGECGTCVERREAFASAGVADPTGYLVEH